MCNTLPLLCSFICGWYLGHFNVLAVVNSAAVNIGVHVSFQIRVSSEYMTGASQMVQWYRICLPVQETLETWVQSLGQEEDTRRRKWQPILVILPGKVYEQRGLVDYSLWGHRRVRHN